MIQIKLNGVYIKFLINKANRGAKRNVWVTFTTRKRSHRHKKKTNFVTPMLTLLCSEFKMTFYKLITKLDSDAKI